MVSEVRGWGLILGVEIAESVPFSAVDVSAALLEDGMLTVPAGAKVVRLVPPLVVSEAEVEEALGKLEAALVKLTSAH